MFKPSGISIERSSKSRSCADRRGLTACGSAIRFLAVLLAVPFLLAAVNQRPPSNLRISAPIYVDGNLPSDCTDGNYSILTRNCTGHDGNAFKTLAKGLKAMHPSDTALIRAGIYNEAILNTIPSGNANTPTTVTNYAGETLTIRPPAGSYWPLRIYSRSYINVVASPRLSIVFDCSNEATGGEGILLGTNPPDSNDPDHITIDGVEVKNVPAMTGGTGGIIPGGYATYITIRNCSVHDISNTEFDHPIYCKADHCLIEKNECYNSYGEGIQVYSTGRTVDSVTIRNNVIHDVALAKRRGNGIILTGTNHLVYNNVIYNVGGGGADRSNNGIRAYSGSGHKIYNNTIYGVKDSGIAIYLGVSSVEVKNNIAFGYGDAAVKDQGVGTVATSNLAADPQFVNAILHNFHLQPSSAAIKAGINLGSVFSVDCDGGSRPGQGAAWDLGAYQYRP